MGFKHSAFLQLVQNAIEKKTVVLNKETDWQEILCMARKAQVVSLVAQGIAPNQEMPDAVRMEFCRIAGQYMVTSHNQKVALREVESCFQANGVEYMLLKGSSVKELYPREDMRSMGDLDMLIKMEQYPRVRQLMLEKGFIEGKETDHELIWYKNNRVLIELHKRLIPSYNEDYAYYFENGWRLAVPTENRYQFRMRPEDEMVYLITHFAKHYRDGGIGIRHMVDFWVFKRAYPQLNEKYILEELEKLQLQVFYQNVMLTLGVWFESQDATPVTDEITNKVFHSGVYGAKDKQTAANALRKTSRSKDVRAAKRKSIRETVFMPLSQMKKRYPVLEKASVLLPVFWVVRWLTALFKGHNRIVWHRERLQAINSSVVTEYRKELNMVGLNFNFEMIDE